MNYPSAAKVALMVIWTCFAICSQHAFASIPGAIGLCEQYPQSPSCAQGQVECTYCHTTTPQLNSYGIALDEALKGLTPPYSTDQFGARLKEALPLVEALDSDGDKESNIDEITKGTLPGDEESNSESGQVVPLVWDANTAFNRVNVLFCGQSPTYEQKQAFNAAADQKAAVHTQLDTCLNSDFWQNEALHRMADNKIKPLSVVGLEGDIVLADYAWDYRLYSHIMTGDRDTRDLLMANYHIGPDGQKMEGVIARQRGFSLQDPLSIGTGQPLEVERRAGMITTQWFLVMNTMFAELPRNTAAQAYRAYLGLDIAKGEGLQPVLGEPRDVDNKNIDQPACAVCHSTLDPLAYSFATYNGIEISFGLIFGNPLGAYDDARQPWEADGVLFGEPVADLMDWAQKAANSDAFKINLAETLFHYAIGRDPNPAEQESFTALWQSIPADGYSANKLIHRIVDTTSFGGQ